MNRTRNGIIAGLVFASFSIAGCQDIGAAEGEVTEDNAEAIVGPLPDPVATATATPMTCMFPQGAGEAVKTCLKQSGPDIDSYVPASCDAIYPDHTWVKAIGSSKTPPKEVWVAIPNADSNFETVQVHGSGATETSYSPSLIHNDGTITGHRECEFKVEFMTSCPAEAPGQPCIAYAQDIDQGGVQLSQ